MDIVAIKEKGELPPRVKPGEWYWYGVHPESETLFKPGDPIYLCFGCLCGQAHHPVIGGTGRVRIVRATQGNHIWCWDGNLEEPTLTPSILHRCGAGGEWHGFLHAGKLVNA